jgi:glycosyltransferase involved in cell wall biosynthesis
MVCVSSDAARLCIAEGVRPELVQTIHNGIDLARFARGRVDARGPAVYVGRLTPEKDVANLLRATAIVAAKVPSFRLLIAGRGPCAPELASLTNSLGISVHVAFLGEVADVPSLLHRASLFVLPSLSEGLPVTALEAMACGLPVVATDVGGTPEAVEDGHTGLIVPAGDAPRLAAAILSVLDNSEWARDMGSAGRARVEGQFDVRAMVAAYERVYGNVLTGSERVAA